MNIKDIMNIKITNIKAQRKLWYSYKKRCVYTFFRFTLIFPKTF